MFLQTQWLFANFLAQIGKTLYTSIILQDLNLYVPVICKAGVHFPGVGSTCGCKCWEIRSKRMAQGNTTQGIQITGLGNLR